MITRSQAYGYVPRFQNKEVVNHVTGTNSQLIRAILNGFPKAVEQTRALAKHFEKESARQSAKSVWEFLKNQLNYRADGFAYQAVKSPSALLATGSGDCKSYSLLAAGILANLGYRVKLRFTGYDVTSTDPSHVYVIASRDGQTFIVDGVWNEFDTEKPFVHKKDFTMQISTITGYNTRQPIRGRGIDAVKKVTLAGPRNAYLALLLINVGGWATKLARANRAAVNEQWEKLGGDPDALWRVIDRAKNKASLLYGGQEKGSFNLASEREEAEWRAANSLSNAQADIVVDPNYDSSSTSKISLDYGADVRFDGPAPGAGTYSTVRIGAVDWAAVAATVAAATPVIIAFADIIKTVSDKPSGDQPGGNGSGTGNGGNTGGGTGTGNNPTGNDGQPTGGGNRNTGLLLAAGAAMLFLLFKK